MTQKTYDILTIRLRIATVAAILGATATFVWKSSQMYNGIISQIHDKNWTDSLQDKRIRYVEGKIDQHDTKIELLQTQITQKR